MSEEDFGLRTLGQVFMPVRGLDRAVGFYRDTLGMRFLFGAPPRMAFFDLDGVRLLLGEPEGSGNPGASILYSKVADITVAHEILTERGVVFDVEPHFFVDMGDHELWLATFKDSEENQLAPMCEVAKS